MATFSLKFLHKLIQLEKLFVITPSFSKKSGILNLFLLKLNI